MEIVLENIAETFVLCVDSFLFGYCIKELLKSRKIINALEVAPFVTINKSARDELAKYPSSTIPYAVVRGTVKALGNPIKSNYNSGDAGVIQVLTVKEHLFARTSAGFWSEQTRTIHSVTNAVPFTLSNGKFQVEVVDAAMANLLDLYVTADRFQAMTPGLMENVWGFVTGVRQKGLQSMEEMLLDGTYVTAIGELSKGEGGTLKIQPPTNGLPMYITTSAKSSLLMKLENSHSHLKLLAVIFGSIAIIMSGRFIWKYIRLKRKHDAEAKLKRQLEESRRQRRATARDKENLTESQVCVVCSENPKEIILLPCGHVCLCEDCSSNINDNCPVCREPIVSKAPAFII